MPNVAAVPSLPESYDVSESGIVIDAVTRVMWSSTTQASETVLWLVHLAGGDVDAPSANASASARVTCARTHEVRATTAEHDTAFDSDGDGWVRDNWTSLAWPADATAAQFTFAQAQQCCTESTIDGGGWRAQSARALMTLVDVRSAELLDTDGAFFRDTQRETWTSSPSVLLDGAAWFVDFQLDRLVDFLVTGDDLVNSNSECVARADSLLVRRCRTRLDAVR